MLAVIFPEPASATTFTTQRRVSNPLLPLAAARPSAKNVNPAEGLNNKINQSDQRPYGTFGLPTTPKRPTNSGAPSHYLHCLSPGEGDCTLAAFVLDN